MKTLEQKKIIELITGLADAQINDQSQVKEIRDIIEKNNDAKFDYDVQFLMKSVISLRFKIKPAPKPVRDKLLRKLKRSNSF